MTDRRDTRREAIGIALAWIGSAVLFWAAFWQGGGQ